MKKLRYCGISALFSLLIFISFYFDIGVMPYHISGAVLCYFFFLLCVGVNIAIGAGKKISSVWALVSCDIGLISAAETLLTGAYWGYRAWGAAWVWEPRLTGMFLMTLFFVSWRLACVVLGPGAAGNGKLTAPLIVLGLPSMAFTHFAVRLFGGIHPSSLASSGGSAELTMLPVVMVLHFILGAWIYRSMCLHKIEEAASFMDAA